MRRDDDHEGGGDDDPVCLGFFEEEGDPSPAVQVVDEYAEAAHVLLASGHHRVAYQLVRHTAELGLKAAIHGLRDWKVGKDPHSLEKLLGELPGDHPLTDPAGDELGELRGFLDEMHTHDAKGDGGRYPTLRSGSEAFGGLCHFSRPGLQYCLDLVEEYLRPVEPSRDHGG